MKPTSSQDAVTYEDATLEEGKETTVTKKTPWSFWNTLTAGVKKGLGYIAPFNTGQLGFALLGFAGCVPMAAVNIAIALLAVEEALKAAGSILLAKKDSKDNWERLERVGDTISSFLALIGCSMILEQSVADETYDITKDKGAIPQLFLGAFGLQFLKGLANIGAAIKNHDQTRLKNALMLLTDSGTGISAVALGFLKGLRDAFVGTGSYFLGRSLMLGIDCIPDTKATPAKTEEISEKTHLLTNGDSTVTTLTSGK